MKASFKFILAALAATAALVGCTKETTPPDFENDKVNPAAEGSRVIAVSFAPQTKTTLEGFQPKFAEGDSILISNGVALDTCEVSVNGDNATFTTELDGLLKAVYSYKAAQIIDTEISDEVLVSTEQDGTFASAHICMAVMNAANDESLSFENKTAVFEITPPEGATAITITSLKPVEDGVARTGTAKVINTDGQTDDDKCVITVSNDTLTTFYVSLVPGVNLSDLSFDAGGTYGMKGIPTSRISTDQTAANTKYTINKENWHPYVTIGDKKWATENIGATDTDPYGTYFSWGALEKVYTALSGNSFTFGANPNTTRYTGTWTAGSGFKACNTPFYYDSAYAKYTGASGDSKSVIELADDAAYANWGGPWRMPTGGTESNADFTALAKAANASYSGSTLSYTQTITTSGEQPSSQGVYYYNVSGETAGVYFVDSSHNKLFFPAAGRGNGTSLSNAGSSGLCWSSSLYSSPSYAYGLSFNSSDVNPQGYGTRYSGRSVRPVSD